MGTFVLTRIYQTLQNNIIFYHFIYFCVIFQDQTRVKLPFGDRFLHTNPSHTIFISIWAPPTETSMLQICSGYYFCSVWCIAGPAEITTFETRMLLPAAPALLIFICFWHVFLHAARSMFFKHSFFDSTRKWLWFDSGRYFWRLVSARRAETRIWRRPLVNKCALREK